MKILFILNDPPYGTERCFNALRLAQALLKSEPNPEITLFLMADAVVCAKTGQKTPNGYYNLERMIKSVSRQAEVVLCGTCMDARGLGDEELVEGTERGTMPQLAQFTIEADKVLVF
ncbi:MAG: DsrE family protein [Rhodospirillales bacterium]|nr:DsrE family protein [Rhodospirillales bacterium]